MRRSSLSMAASLHLYYALILLLAFRASAVPVSNVDPICSHSELIGPSQTSVVYKYKTEVKLSVANAQFDLKNEITADVHLRGIGNCLYALQLRNVKVTETEDEKETTVTSTANAQKELENVIVRFRYVDGSIFGLEADASAKVDHINFIKGIVSALQVHSPVPTDSEVTVREEDVLGVCTTRYKYSQKAGTTQIVKNKDLATCSRDKLHLSSSPVLTALFGPIVENVFSAKTRYVCQTDVRDKKIQSVKCKTIEIDKEDEKKHATKHSHDDDEIHGVEDSSSEEDFEVKFNDKDDEEISTKLVSIKQELKLQTTVGINVDGGAVKSPVRQTLQFIPTASFEQSNQAVSTLVTKIQGLLKSADWNQFAAARFVEVTNELRRMDRAKLNSFKANTDLKHLVPTFLSTIYAHDPAASLLNLDLNTLKFANPLSVFYSDDPSSDLVDQVIQGARKLTPGQVPEFVGLAAAVLKSYKARQTNKDADAKIKEFHKLIAKFLSSSNKAENNVTTATLSAYAQLGLYDDQVRRLAANDQAPIEVQYHALNAIRHICPDEIDDNDEDKIRSDLQGILLKKLQNKANKNLIRVGAFEAVFTSFIYNSEEDDSTLGDTLEKTLHDILNEPINQVNGYIWSALKYSSLDPLCPLRGLSARLRAHHHDKKQFMEQPTLSSRQLKIDLPLGKNYHADIQLSAVFENDRATPSFLGVKLAFNGIRRETLHLPWIDLALIVENLDWNLADYFLRLDPLNPNKNVNDEYREKAKTNLPIGLKKLQDARDQKDEDPDPSVHMYLKLFGADFRSKDITDKVQDVLRSNLRTFIRNQFLNGMKDLSGKDPIFRLPLEIGAASGAANGLTLYKSAQLGLLADLTSHVKTTQDKDGLGIFSLHSTSALSFSVTLQREVSSPLTTIGETVHIGGLSNVPFEYTAVATREGRVREFNLDNTQSTVLATDFEYSLRTSAGFKSVPNPKSATVDPSCTPSVVYRVSGLQFCLELNPFRSIQLGTRPSYPITIHLRKDPSVKKWRIGWRFNAPDAPQYEVAVEKVGSAGSYPGLGISATKTGNNFDVKVLTGMKSFHVKGTQTGTKFDGKVYSSDNKEVYTAAGTLVITSDAFKLDTKLSDSATKKEVVQLTGDILANKGQGLKADISLSTPDKARSVKINFLGDLYKPDQKLFHIDGGFTLGDTSYTGKAHLERNADRTRIELRRQVKLGKSPAPAGYDFVYERKNPKENADPRVYTIASHLTVRNPKETEPIKVFDFTTDFNRARDLANATIHSVLDLRIVTRTPAVQERIEFDYVRRSIRPSNQAQRLVSPQADLKIHIKTKSNVFDFLIDHRHQVGSGASKKGPVTVPPTIDIDNKIHIVLDTDKLLPDIPRPLAFDILSDLEFELLNQLNYTFRYNLRRRQRAGEFIYRAQVDKVTDGHLYSGKSTADLTWNNKQNKASGKGTFVICTNRRSLRSHWDIDTNLVTDKNDIELDLEARFDRQPKKDALRSFIGLYNITLKAPKHENVQLIDADGNVTWQSGALETYNSIAYKIGQTLKEINLNVIVDRNHTGDNSFQSHVALSLPFKNLPYITHDLMLERAKPHGHLGHLASQLVAKPVFAHYGSVNIDRPTNGGPPRVHVDNEIEYLRANGDSLLGMSKVDVHRWSTLSSFGLIKRNNDLLHKHSIGYEFSNKTRKVALSLSSPQLSGNGLSLIGEVTIDRENRIGKMKWPQEFGVHFEFGTPLFNLTALHLHYNLPLFSKDDTETVDASIGFKLASPKIAPISFYLNSEGSLATTLHITESLHIGHEIALSTLLTAQYHPQSTSQLSASTSAEFYGQNFQHSIYTLFKQHQVLVRGILNTTDDHDYNYEIDVGFADDILVGHSERSSGKETVVSDIAAKNCAPTGKFARCYKGDITVKTGSSGAGKKGTFDVSWGSGAAKLDIKVPDQLEIKFDHAHTGRLRADDFTSKTMIEGKSLRSDNKGAFSYAGSADKSDGKWNDVQLKSSLTDGKTGGKALENNFHLNQKITDKRTGESQRTIELELERKGQPVINWSSKAVSCKQDPSKVIQGICETATFTLKASTQLAQRLRQRLQLPADPKLASAGPQITYDGTLNLDLKPDPKQGPHKLILDLNRLKDDAVDVNLAFQPRIDDSPMNLKMTAKLPRQEPISVKYDETRESKTKFIGTLKYSFNANDNAAEKTYKCEVNRPGEDVLSANCKGERTTLTVDMDRKAGKIKAYVDLNKFQGDRIGVEAMGNMQSKEFDVTLYTLVNAWHVKRQPGKSTVLVVKQKDREVLRIEGNRIGPQEIQFKFSPANVNLKLEWDNSTVITLKQTAPQQRDLITVNVDRAKIRRYLPTLRNQNIPDADIDQPGLKSRKSIVEIAFDSHVFLALFQPTDKLGSHNGRFGLDTVKKTFLLQVGDASLTVQNIQHWKTHGQNTELPESFSVRIINPLTGNFVELSSTKWDEHRLITSIDHSLDGGKTTTTDLSINRNYAHQVGSLYFFHSVGYRNIAGVKQLRNLTRTFVRTHLTKDLNKTFAFGLLKDFRQRLRAVIEADYAALKEIATSWSKEPEKNVLRRFGDRLGLVEFFTKYPTYAQASDRIFAVIRQRAEERQEFWRNRTQAILDDNRLLALSERVQARRSALIKRLLDRAEKLLDRVLPKIDQTEIDKRIASYVTKILAGFEAVSKRNTETWKTIFKAIDDASKGDENKWFRTLVADIDSVAFASAADAESTKMFKKLGDSMKLLISNIQQLSRRMNKRREAIRERVKNAIRHIPKAFINGTNFELLVPTGRQPGSYTGMQEMAMAVGSLIRNRDQAVDTIRSVLQNRLQSRFETMKNYRKAMRTIAKRLFKRNPSLVPEFKAVITQTGEGIDVHGNYIYLNPTCDYLLAHDFADLQFSFRYTNGKIYSLIPNEGEIKEYQCSKTGRVQACCGKDHCTINVPMYYGGRVDGALGDVRDRSGKGHENLNRWLLRDCPAASRDELKSGGAPIFECASDDDDLQEFCEHFVRNGLKNNQDKRRLLAEVKEIRKEWA